MSGPSNPEPALIIREAVPGDLPTIVEFNRLLALETESKVLDAQVLLQGVAQALSDPDRIRYWVAAPLDSSLPGRPGRDHPRVERLAQRLDLVVPERLHRPALPPPGSLPRPLPPHPRRGPLAARTSSACGSTSKTPTSALARLISAWHVTRRILGLPGTLDRANSIVLTDRGHGPSLRPTCGSQSSPQSCSAADASASRKPSRAVAAVTPALTEETTPTRALSTSSPMPAARAFSMRLRVQTWQPTSHRHGQPDQLLLSLG